ncbi:hypothetical protein PGT21_012802 [Puccinia graminis f. sp. tritici]|uniref:Uncharacterized protein n=1 Tax=Puccinia graminis f. sp. tritici TaxID=56615 RepID=A0A5B0LLD9_PUCGR|nr:hypothetical protein PGT21_012802 [Puccinia graminis f. sp. tritici]
MGLTPRPKPRVPALFPDLAAPLPQPVKGDRSFRAQQHSIRLWFEQVAARQHREEDKATALLVSMAFAGGPIQQMRTYLTRGDLPGDPMADSAWAYMFSGQND